MIAKRRDLLLPFWFALLFVFSLTLATTSPSVLQQGQNLVPNPSFEEGIDEPDGWTICPDSSAWDDEVVHTGARSARVEGTCIWNSISFSLQPGTYYLGFWHREAPGTIGALIRLLRNGEEFLDFEDSASQDWLYYEASFEISQTSNVSIQLYTVFEFDTGGTTWYDDLWLSTGPPPEISPTPTSTPTATETSTSTPTPTSTATGALTPTPTSSPTVGPTLTATQTPTATPTEEIPAPIICGEVQRLTHCSRTFFQFGLVSCTEPDRPFILNVPDIPGDHGDLVRLNNPVTRSRDPFCSIEYGDIEREIFGFESFDFINSCSECGIPNADTDHDGLLDDWEINGIDINGDNVPEINLPAMGADFRRKDVFVEIDWMELDEDDDGITSNDPDSPNDHSHRPKEDAIRMIMEAFDSAPMDGRGINLHVDAGPNSIMDFRTGRRWGELSRSERIPHVDVLGEAEASLPNAVEALRNNNFFRNQGQQTFRQHAFHYSIFGHQFLNPPDGNCNTGVSFGNDQQTSLVTLGCSADQEGSVNEQSGTFMHELGHNLNLEHGGNESAPVDENTDEELWNHKPNYLSVMNYMFQTSGLIIDGNDGHFDYSRFDLPTLDEARLSQANGLNGGQQIARYGTKHYCAGPIVRRWNPGWARANNANGPIDWDCNVATIYDITQYDVNHAGGNSQPLRSFNDWRNLRYRAGQIGQRPSAVLSVEEASNGDLPEPPFINELTPQKDLQYQRISEPRVQLSLAVTPSTVQPGEAVEYELKMLNTDASDVLDVFVTHTLPPGFIYQLGSTGGVTTEDPAIDGQNLTWGGFTVPLYDGVDLEELTLTFQVTASNVPGTYLSSVSGTSTNGIVIPTGDTAPLTVQTVSPTPTAGPVARAVGGYGVPLGILELLLPWIAIVLAIGVVSIGMMLARRRTA